MNSIMTQQEIEEKLKEINEINDDLLFDVADIFECLSIDHKKIKDLTKSVAILRNEFTNAECDTLWENLTDMSKHMDKQDEHLDALHDRLDSLFGRLSQVENLVGLTNEPKEKKLIITNRMPKKKRNKYRLHCGDEFESNKALAEYCETNPAVVSRWINVMGWVKKVKKVS